jgi:periplasmic protein TonB
MKSALFLGILCALGLHGGVLLFGGLLFAGAREDHGTLQQVELLAPDEPEAEKQKPEEQPQEQELETQAEQAPDATEILRDMEQPLANDAPALDAASLGALEQALAGGGSGGDFAGALSLASGGRIGGTGKAGALDEKLEGAFSLSEIDQKPRPVFQAGAMYPSEMRGKKVDGSVTVTFLVDASGKVASPKALRSTHQAFEKPALEAVKQWRFEPAVKAGQRVGCRMRVEVRFPPG